MNVDTGSVKLTLDHQIVLQARRIEQLEAEAAVWAHRYDLLSGNLEWQATRIRMLEEEVDISGQED